MSTIVGTWRAALACFVVAAATGTLFRFQLAYGWDTGLALVHVRHAHSHLMYFGWVTPALTAFIAARAHLTYGHAPTPRLRALLLGIFVASMVSWPLFLLFGYESTRIGDATLPPAMIAASVHVVLWYALLLAHARSMRGAPRKRAVLAWHGAWAFLFLSTLGAWGLSAMVPFDVDAPLVSEALIHVFLDLFSEGWFLLGLLGLAWAELAPDARGWHWSLVLILLGTPVGFLLSLSADALPWALRIVASVGGAAAGIGVMAQAVMLLRRTAAWRWRVPLAALALVGAGRLIVAAVPTVGWQTLMGLRILYLHLLLLGFVTLGLFAAADDILGRARPGAWLAVTAAALLVIASLLPLSVLWPSFLGRGWAFQAAAWLGLGPVLAVTAALFISSRAPTLPARTRRRE